MRSSKAGIIGWRRLVGDRRFYHDVAVIVVPMIIQNLVSNVVNLLDNVMVGAVGALPMAAVAIVNQLIFVFYLAIFGGLSGAGIFSTQYAGAKNDNGVRNCHRLKLYIVVATTAVALGVFLLFPNFLINCYLKSGAEAEEVAETVSLSHTYLRVMLWGLLPFSLTMLYASTLRELGETKMPMIASVVAILVNLLFNYLLIFGKCGFPVMGVEGAAVATVLSRLVEMAIIVGYTHFQAKKFVFIQGAYRTWRIPAVLVKDVFRRGFPLLFNEILWALAQAMLLQCYSIRGIHVITAVNIAFTVANIFNCAFFSMGSAVAVMVGHELGANNMEGAKDMAWKLIVLTVAVCLVCSGMICLSAPFIPRLYNIDDELRHLATTLLLICTSSMPFISFSHASYFTIRAGGRSYITCLLDSGFSWFMLLPVTWVVGHCTDLPIEPFFFISRWTELFKMILAYYLVRSGVWLRNIVADK